MLTWVAQPQNRVLTRMMSGRKRSAAGATTSTKAADMAAQPESPVQQQIRGFGNKPLVAGQDKVAQAQPLSSGYWVGPTPA